MVRLCLMIPLFGLMLATPLCGQASEAGRAVIEIGDVLSFRVEPGGAWGTSIVLADGDGVTRVEVLSNRPWRLLRVGGEGEDRVDGSPGPVSGLVVGRGLPGRVTLEVDSSWLDPGGQGLESSETARLVLFPD